MNVVIILGSVRPKGQLGPGLPGRVSTRVGAFCAKQLGNDCVVKIIEPDDPDFALELMSMPYHWAKATKTPIKPNLQRLVDTLAWADAVICVTPEYNLCMSTALLNILDHVPPRHYGGPLRMKPALTVSYSMNKAGGVRAQTQLRAVVSELGCTLASANLAIPEAHLCLTEDGVEIPVGPKKETPLAELMALAKTELFMLTKALKQVRSESKKSKL